MAVVMASLTQLPFLVASCVLFGFALWGWRRTRMTGVLLIAIAAGLQVLHQLFGLWTMSLLYTRGVSAAATMGVYGAVRGAGSLVAEVLFIVGVALVLRRLPAAPR